MAVTKTVLKNTNQETVVKVAGADASVTIDLQTDCLAGTQALDGATQTVNIISANWTGLPSSTITVARNSVTVLPITGDQPQMLDLAGQGYVDTIENTSDIVVTIAGTAAVYLVLRKVNGYATKVEYATYGAYDDPTRVGASTTMSGSPDKV